jgi:ribosomal protein S18 acetylase RimI-like enzyme
VNVLTTFQEFRGQGIGRALLEVAEKRAYAAGASTMSIIVGSWNEGAERLYQRAGYERIASEPAILPAGFPQSGDWLLLTKPVAP